MRIAIAAFQIESVSFLPQVADIEDFERVALRGASILEKMRGTNSAVGGFIDVLEREQAHIVPLVDASLGALGPASERAVQRYCDEIVDGLRAHDGLDGVLLFLHGASWSQGHEDPERYIIGRVREAIGPQLPLVIAFDYHGNIDADTLRGVTAAFAYQKSPHTDMAQTGIRAARCLVATVRGEIQPVWTIRRPHVVVPSIFSATSLSPLADILALARAREAASNTWLDVSEMAGFAYADAHNTGYTVIAVADGDHALAARTADDLAAALHRHRAALYRPLKVWSIEEALAHACGRPPSGKPRILLEHADRMNDSTHVLAALLARGEENVAVPFLWDPQAARLACAAGAGATIAVALGGHSSDKAGPRLQVTARVRQLGPARAHYTGPVFHGVEFEIGPSALLEIDGILVSVTSFPAFGIDDAPFRMFGLRPEDFRLVVLRSKTHFRSFYEPIADEILVVDTPDYGAADLTQFDYRRLNTAMNWPFSQDAPRS
ncbi:MAG: M81 family metallopeptidase [Paraburkholderia sp.]|nr:M81 family metallopeptidase [Paraburkholderia sp.]